MKKRLLIVDDEPRMTGSFKVIFESRGFIVHTASNGYDAIEIFKNHLFKVVLTDIHMNKMDGISLMHALKQVDSCVQIIFLTGYANLETATKALKQNNAFEYFVKPIKNLEKLFKTVDKAEKKYDCKKNELILKEKNKKGFAIFRDIFDSMEAVVYVSDIQTHELIYINRKALETLGCPDWKEIEGLKCWQALQKDQKGPCPFCTNKMLLEPDGSPGPPYEWEFRNTRNLRWYNIVDKAILWYDKRIVRLETAFDITEKKEHEKLFREFEKAIETSRRFESISTLAGGVAHDFNNTLSAVIGNINLAQISCHDPETLRFLKTAEKGIMQAKGISSKLIAFAKGGRPLKKKVNIKKLIREILENNLNDTKINYSFKCDPIPGSFYADLSQLRIAIKNILQNSIESIDGMGKITISIKYLDDSSGNPRISIIISDSGHGISRDHLDMVFNPYFTTKPLDYNRSKGLGLSVVWAIITRHGGKIHIESTLKKGTMVHILLPVSKNGLEDETRRQMQNKPALDKTIISVLVMDDDELILEVISQLLKRLGYETLSASDGNQAVNLCKTARMNGKTIDIALLDFDIKKGLGGFVTMEQLKKINPDIKGLLITGFSDNTEIKKYKMHGFSDCLEKPFTIRQLNEKINKILH